MWHKYKQISFITCQPSINHLENSKLGRLSGVTYLCLPQKEQGAIDDSFDHMLWVSRSKSYGQHITCSWSLTSILKWGLLQGLPSY